MQDGYTVVIVVEISHIQMVGEFSNQAGQAGAQTNILGNTTVKAFGAGGSEWEAYSVARERGIAELENALSQVQVLHSEIVAPS